MAKARTLVGLDVHATKIVAAVLDAETGEVQWFRLGGDAGEAAGLCAGLPAPVRRRALMTRASTSPTACRWSTLLRATLIGGLYDGDRYGAVSGNVSVFALAAAPVKPCRGAYRACRG